MINFIKKWLTGRKKTELCFESFTAGEISELRQSQRTFHRVHKKLERVVLAQCLLEEAKTPAQIDILKRCIPKIFGTMEGFAKLQDDDVE